MTGPGFIHLHVHSAYSLLEGALQLETILKLAGEDAQPALGIADTGNLFGALEFSEKASKKGIQPLVGVELAIDFAAGEERINERGHVAWAGKSSVVLIAQNETGFGNLSRLVSQSYIEGDGGTARAQLDWLSRERLEGLICLSGGPEGLCPGPGRQCHPPARPAGRAVWRALLYRAAAAWPRAGGCRRAASGGLCLSQGHSAGGDQ